MSLKGILKKAKQRPPVILVHGGPAVGKTTLGSQFPKPIIFLWPKLLMSSWTI